MRRASTRGVTLASRVFASRVWASSAALQTAQARRRNPTFRRTKHEINVPTWAKYKRDQPSSKNYLQQHAENRNLDYIIIGAAGMGVAMGGRQFVNKLLAMMNPSAAVKAQANSEVDISGVEEGSSQIFTWRGKPVFIRNRTPQEIATANKDDSANLPDSEPDSERVKAGRENWLVVVGICTHLGCIPIADQGDFGGWFCPCHGSHYDVSGRVRKGPAPLNLAVPPYYFIDDNTVLIGKDSAED
eukprot:TRINITY_DN3180_c0_g1_i2.p1 TRINITY_DN3180_c0_g1~~TRINITY_DN3180_c0_g1_i2.p1  ORF type:complete len:244 (-),score=41.01 TRINITY_DN3180_c0_g1_i2:66-797(-)